MGDIITFTRRPSRWKTARAGVAATVTDIEGSPRRCLNSALYNVGFDDHLQWHVLKPFRHDHIHNGLIATPDFVAMKNDGSIRIVKMFEGDRPPQLDAHSIITANLDCWVLSARLFHDKQRPEVWAVFDDGERFELQPALPIAQAHAKLALRKMRAEGLHELSTSEAASMVI